MTIVPVIVALALPALGGTDPAISWRTMTTAHFNVHYYQGRERFASRVAEVAEASFRVVTPFLKHTPVGRTEVVVVDSADAANGAAGVLPLKTIVVLCTGPEALSELGDADDWVRGLVLHEFAHIVHLDTIGGLANVLNHILGRQFAPNQNQPTWFIEGLAVYAETAFTTAGRGRSSLFEMYMRAQVLDGAFEPLDRATGYSRAWPHGTLAYLMGGKFLSFVAERYGAEKFAEVSRRYGARFIPFGLNVAAREVWGKDYPTLYREWHEALAARFRDVERRVRERGLTTSAPLTTRGETNIRPRYSPDSREVYYVSNDARSYPTLRGIDRASRRDRRIFDWASDSAPALVASGTKVLFHQGEVFRTHYNFNDLFVGDLRSGVVEQVTHGMRARDPDALVAPPPTASGEWVFTVNRAGTRNLAVMAPDGRGFRLVTGWDDFSLCDTPRWSPDGARVVFSAWRSEEDERGEKPQRRRDTEGRGRRDLYIWEKETGAIARLTDDSAIDAAPAWARDGRSIYFSSDRDGIYNIYRIDLANRAVTQVTNVLTGAFDPDPSPDGKSLVFARYSANGWDIHEMRLSTVSAPAPALAAASTSAFVTAARSGPFPSGSSSYNPLRTLLPKTWFPILSSDAKGTTAGAMTSGADVLGRHAYVAQVVVGANDANRGEVSFAAGYSLSVFTPTITVDASRSRGVVGALVSGALVGVDELKTTGRITVLFPWSRREESQWLYLSYDLERLSLDKPSTVVDPADPHPVFSDTGLLAGLTVGAAYSRVRGYSWSVSPEEGRSFAAEVRFRHASLGSDFTTILAAARYTEYIPLWWRHHVLALRLSGGLGAGDFRSRRVFSLGSFELRDIFFDLLSGIRVGSSPLRGFGPVQSAGDAYLLGTAEYRLPLFNLQRGIETLPLFFDRVHLGIFTDVGGAFDKLTAKSLVVGVGAELLLDLVVGYHLPANIRFGYARGLARGGIDNVYLVLGNRF